MRERRYLLGSVLVVLAMISALSIAGCGGDEKDNMLDPGITDSAPPLPPTGTQLLWQLDSKFAVGWSANSEPDLSGYRVYRYEPDPSRTSAYVCISGQSVLAMPRLTVPGSSGTLYTLRVTAVDSSGNESSLSESFTFTFSPSSAPPTGEGDNGSGRGAGGGQDRGGDEPSEQGDPSGRG